MGALALIIAVEIGDNEIKVKSSASAALKAIVKTANVLCATKSDGASFVRLSNDTCLGNGTCAYCTTT
jgi:hypothetical protein